MAEQNFYERSFYDSSADRLDRRYAGRGLRRQKIGKSVFAWRRLAMLSCNRVKITVGDKGQRYEHWCDTADGPMRIGWSSAPDTFKEAVEKHPSWHNHRVVDRQANEELVTKYYDGKPGNYLCTCLICHHRFIGAKLDTQCPKCAEDESCK